MIQYQILLKVKALILSIASLMLLSSCTSTQIVTETKYIVSTPAKIDRPVKPEFETLNSKKPITDKDNFKKLQINISLLKNYTLSLQDVIDYYESEIDRMNAENNK